MVIVIICATTANAQTPQRVVASTGLPGATNRPVWEPAIAAGPDEVMAVYINHNNSAVGGIGYVIYDRLAEEWGTPGRIPDADTTMETTLLGQGDPSIIAIDDGFLACAMANDPNGTCIATAAYDGGDGWAPWVRRSPYYVTTSTGIDKPWLVAGELTTEGQECYITYSHGIEGNAVGYAYLRSLDGGVTWVHGEIEVDSEPNEGLLFGAQPAVSGAGPLLVAYTVEDESDLLRVKFVIGTDQMDGSVEFSVPPCEVEVQAMNPIEPPPCEGFLLNHFKAADFIPGDGSSLATVNTVPYLVADPSDDTRQYLVYHDRPNLTSTDFDIFVRRIDVIDGILSLHLPERANDDDPNGPTENDQFTPSAAVGDDGTLHITFYDDREYAQADSESTPVFDHYYVASTDGASFADNVRLIEGSDPEPPAFDYSLPIGSYPTRLTDYNGVATYGEEVWIAFTGTLEDDPGSDSVIWAVLP